jgi:hypothetical protein
VEQGSTVAVRVEVACPLLKELQVWVECDPAALQIDGASLWVNPARVYNAYDPAAAVEPATFMTAPPGSGRVMFWLQKSAEPGDPVWRVSAATASSVEPAVFGFSVQGLTRAPAALSFYAAFPPYARNMNFFAPDEIVTAVAGSVLVYRPAGPVVITPPAGSYNHAIEVRPTSEYAARVVYTLDGSTPDAGSTELALGQALYLGGTDGEQVSLRVLAFGEAGAPAAGAADYRFDLAPPVVTAASLTTAAGRPTLHGTVSEAAAGVQVTVSGVTAAAVNDGSGGWSLDLGLVLGEDLAEGVYDVAVTATDSAGNSSSDGTSGELTVDRTPPQGGFTIGTGNPAYVASVATTLAVSVSGAAEMRFRSSGDDWGPWVAYAAAVPWSLVAPDGPKAVLGEFRDAAGNLLATADSVGLDTTLPGSEITTVGTYGPLTWPGEVSGTATDAFSGVARVEVECVRSDTGEYWTGAGWSGLEIWLPASGMNPWSLELGATVVPTETVIRLRSRAVDRAGNAQLPADQSAFSYDGTAPVGVFSVESAGTIAVGGRLVTLTCAVGGAAQMRFREGAGAWTSWLPFAVAPAWELSDGDGQKVLQAAFADAAGNVLELSDDILLDRAAPVTRISTTGGYGPTSWPGAVSGTVTDSTSGVAVVTVAVLRLPAGKAAGEYWDGAAWVAGGRWLTASLTGASWSVPLSEAALEEGGDARGYRVSASSQDYAGNQESPTVTTDFLFDSHIPAGGFGIGTGNPLYLNTVSVTLSCDVTAGHALEMRFRNEGEGFPGTWLAYAATLPWVLPAGNGLKTVYGEFRDTENGNILATSDAVTIDADAPASTLAASGIFGPATWPGSIGGTATDAGPAGVERVELTILRGDGQYWHGSGWQATAVRLSVGVTAGSWAQGFAATSLSDATTYFLSSRAVDRAGNLQTNPATAVVSYDSSAPGGAFMVGSGDPAATATRDVTLAIAVTGATEMSFRNVGGAWSAWEPVAVTRPLWQLIGGDGAKQVSGRFRDGVGNLFETDDSILYDSTTPTSAVGVTGVCGPLSWPGSVSGTAADALSGVARVEVQVQRGSDGAFWNGSAWGLVGVWLAAAGSVSWQVPLASGQLLSGVTYSLVSRAVDHAGNEQSPAGSASFLFDAGRPTSTIRTPPVVGLQSWPGAIEGEASDTLSGVQSVTLQLVRVLAGEFSHWDGSSWQPGFADAPWLMADGTQGWRYVLPVAGLSHGASYTVTSRATDGVGNVQSPLASRSFAYDGVAPAIPTLTGIATDSGAVGDLITNDRTLVFVGQAEAGSTVEMRLGGVIVGSVSAGGGTWTVDHSGTALAAGAHLIELAAIDAAGNRSAWSAPLSLIIDTVAPVLTCGLAVGARLNGSAAIAFTTDGVGAVEASFDQAQWTAVQSGVSVLGVVGGFGGLPQGAFTLYLRDSDVAGNVGRTQVALIKDTLAPTGYSLSINQVRINAANRQALTFTLTGAEAGSVCEYTIATAGRGAVAGSFSVLAATQTSPVISVEALADGLLTVQGLLRDTVGNGGGVVSDQVEKDTTAPTGYAVRIAAAAINAANRTQFTCELSGGEVGAVCHYAVQSADGGTPVAGSATVGAATSSLGPLDVSALADGTLTLTVLLTDTFGNSGLPVSDQVLKDVLAPPVPAVESWTQPVNQATARAFACAGQAEAGTTVLYRILSSAGLQVVEGSTPAAGDGRFAASGIDVSSLADGALTLTVSGRDPAGNQSAYGGDRAAQKDTVAPVLACGFAAGARLNGTEAIAFTTDGVGTAEASFDQAQWTAVQTGVSGLGVVAGFGGLPQGSFTLYLRDSDAAGNVGRTQVALIKDTEAPAGYSLSVDQARINAANRQALTFTLSGAEVGSVCEYTIVTAGRAVVAGSFSVSAATQTSPVISVEVLADGLLTVQGLLRDTVGNGGGVVSDQVEKDTTAPTGYAVRIAAAAINAANRTQFTCELSGGEVGAVCNYAVQSAGGGTPVAGSSTVGAATSSLGPLDVSALADGTLTLTVFLTDAFGNSGLPVADQVLKDVLAPPVPAVESWTQPVNQATATAFACAGQAEAGATVLYRVVSSAGLQVVEGSTPAAGDGRFAVSGIDVSSLADGTLTLTVSGRDQAGNQSAYGGDRVAQKDTVAPVLTCGFAAGARLNGTEAIAFTTDGAGTAEASVDQTQWTAVQSGTSLLGAVTGFGSLSQGAFTLYLRDSDVAGNVGRTQVILIKDTLVPAGYSLSVDQAWINAANQQALSFTLTGADPGSVCEYAIAAAGRAVVAGSFGVATETQASPAISVAGLDDGSLTVQASLRDAAGNVGSTVSDQVEKDTVAPAGYAVRIEASIISAANQTQFAFQLSGAEVGAVCQYAVRSAGGGPPVAGSAPVAAPTSGLGPLDVSALPDGTLTLTAYLTDAFGNLGLPASGQVPKDVLAPPVPVVESWTQPVNRATATAFACAGQTEAGATVFCRIGSSAGPGMIEVSTTAGGDGHFALSGIDVSSLADGTLALTVSGQDAAGNQSVYGGSRTAWKDTEPPAAPLFTTVTPVVNAGNVAHFAFAGTGEWGATAVYTLASLSGATEVSGTLPISEGGAFSLSGLDTTALPDGSLQLHVLVRDPAGNLSPEATSAPITKDTAAPTVTLDSPAAGSRVNGDEVFRFTASEPVVVRASLDRVAWFDIVSGTSRLGDVPGFAALGDTLFAITLSATDAAGNVVTDLHDLTKDTSGPTGYDVVFEEEFVDLSETGEVAFVILNGEVGAAFSYEIADAVGGRGVVSGSGLVSASPQRVAGVSVAALVQGGLTLRLRLADAAGNVGPDAVSETTLGTTQILALAYGWNAVGVIVAPLVPVGEILSEAAGRVDGALIRGGFNGYRGGQPLVLGVSEVLQFGGAYRVFASRAGTLRLRGVAGIGVGSLPVGWAYVAPGADQVAADFPAAWSVWADAEPGRGYRPLADGALLAAGTPVWVLVLP